MVPINAHILLDDEYINIRRKIEDCLQRDQTAIIIVKFSLENLRIWKNLKGIKGSVPKIDRIIETYERFFAAHSPTVTTSKPTKIVFDDKNINTFFTNGVRSPCFAKNKWWNTHAGIKMDLTYTLENLTNGQLRARTVIGEKEHSFLTKETDLLILGNFTDTMFCETCTSFKTPLFDQATQIILQNIPASNLSIHTKSKQIHIKVGNIMYIADYIDAPSTHKQGDAVDENTIFSVVLNGQTYRFQNLGRKEKMSSRVTTETTSHRRMTWTVENLQEKDLFDLELYSQIHLKKHDIDCTFRYDIPDGIQNSLYHPNVLEYIGLKDGENIFNRECIVSEMFRSLLPKDMFTSNNLQEYVLHLPARFKYFHTSGDQHLTKGVNVPMPTEKEHFYIPIKYALPTGKMWMDEKDIRDDVFQNKSNPCFKHKKRPWLAFYKYPHIYTQYYEYVADEGEYKDDKDCDITIDFNIYTVCVTQVNSHSGMKKHFLFETSNVQIIEEFSYDYDEYFRIDTDDVYDNRIIFQTLDFPEQSKKQRYFFRSNENSIVGFQIGKQVRGTTLLCEHDGKTFYTNLFRIVKNVRTASDYINFNNRWFFKDNQNTLVNASIMEDLKTFKQSQQNFVSKTDIETLATLHETWDKIVHRMSLYSYGQTIEVQRFLQTLHEYFSDKNNRVLWELVVTRPNNAKPNKQLQEEVENAVTSSDMSPPVVMTRTTSPTPREYVALIKTWSRSTKRPPKTYVNILSLIHDETETTNLRKFVLQKKEQNKNDFEYKGLKVYLNPDQSYYYQLEKDEYYVINLLYASRCDESVLLKHMKRLSDILETSIVQKFATNGTYKMDNPCYLCQLKSDNSPKIACLLAHADVQCAGEKVPSAWKLIWSREHVETLEDGIVDANFTLNGRSYTLRSRNIKNQLASEEIYDFMTELCAIDCVSIVLKSYIPTSRFDDTFVARHSTNCLQSLVPITRFDQDYCFVKTNPMPQKTENVTHLKQDNVYSKNNDLLIMKKKTRKSGWIRESPQMILYKKRDERLPRKRDIKMITRTHPNTYFLTKTFARAEKNEDVQYIYTYLHTTNVEYSNIQFEKHTPDSNNLLLSNLASNISNHYKKNDSILFKRQLNSYNLHFLQKLLASAYIKNGMFHAKHLKFKIKDISCDDKEFEFEKPIGCVQETDDDQVFQTERFTLLKLRRNDLFGICKYSLKSKKTPFEMQDGRLFNIAQFKKINNKFAFVQIFHSNSCDGTGCRDELRCKDLKKMCEFAYDRASFMLSTDYLSTLKFDDNVRYCIRKTSTSVQVTNPYKIVNGSIKNEKDDKHLKLKETLSLPEISRFVDSTICVNMKLFASKANSNVQVDDT
jgi:hypothetical protein